MVGEVFAGLGAFKAMLDMAKRLKDISDVTTRNAVAIELQEKILTAQEQQAALIQRVRELEEKVASFETWDTEKKRYELHDFGGSTFAYALKEGMENGEPPHRICAACYQNSRKSILHFRGRNAWHQDMYGCPACKHSFSFGTREKREPRVIQRGPSWRV